MNARQRRHRARARQRRIDGATPSTRSLMAGPDRSRKAVRLTATQRDSTGKRSDWTRSPYYFTDPAWSATVGDLR